MKTIEFYLTHGISRVVLGSAALSNPSLVAEAVKEFGAQLAVGIDAKNRKVATRGWLDTSEMDFLELARRMEDMGVQTLIYTDISRDGTLKGPSFDQLRELSGEVCCKVIASGWHRFHRRRQGADEAGPLRRDLRQVTLHRHPGPWRGCTGGR